MNDCDLREGEGWERAKGTSPAAALQRLLHLYVDFTSRLVLQPL
jgi:hypothetical protein